MQKTRFWYIWNLRWTYYRCYWPCPKWHNSHFVWWLPADTQDINDEQYLLEGMKMLPAVTSLTLCVTTNGHAFGASLFHILKLCSGTKKLDLEFSRDNLEVKLLSAYIICICISWFTKPCSASDLRYWLHVYIFVANFICCNWLTYVLMMTVYSIVLSFDWMI